MSKIGAFIPARYAATRFPAKLMQMLGDKSVIRHTYDNTKATGLFDEVYVVTDSEIIFNEIVTNGGKAIMSKKVHESGSDRIAEAIKNLDIDIVVNVQGDEPFVKREPLEKARIAGELMAYKHNGFWHCMDTLRDHTVLNNLWATGKAPWKIW